MSSLQLASLAKFHWKQVVTFYSGVPPRSPNCTEGQKKKKKSRGLTSSWDVLALKFPACFNTERCRHTQAGQEHNQELHCPVSPRPPQQARKRVLEMLWFQSSPQELVLADREMERKGIIFSLHQATLMPLDRKDQKTCLRVEKEGREEM